MLTELPDGIILHVTSIPKVLPWLPTFGTKLPRITDETGHSEQQSSHLPERNPGASHLFKVLSSILNHGVIKMKVFPWTRIESTIIFCLQEH